MNVDYEPFNFKIGAHVEWNKEGKGTVVARHLNETQTSLAISYTVLHDMDFAFDILNEDEISTYMFPPNE